MAYSAPYSTNTVMTDNKDANADKSSGSRENGPDFLFLPLSSLLTFDKDTAYTNAITKPSKCR